MQGLILNLIICFPLKTFSAKSLAAAEEEVKHFFANQRGFREELVFLKKTYDGSNQTPLFWINTQNENSCFSAGSMSPKESGLGSAAAGEDYRRLTEGSLRIFLCSAGVSNGAAHKSANSASSSSRFSIAELAGSPSFTFKTKTNTHCVSKGELGWLQTDELTGRN